MRAHDLAPLHRFTVGFDNVGRLLDTAARPDDAALSYPPYNIEKLGDDDYRVTMAVAGFSDDDLDITVHDNTLVISGRLAKPDAADEGRRTTVPPRRLGQPLEGRSQPSGAPQGQRH